jgi:hypothetical protein
MLTSEQSSQPVSDASSGPVNAPGPYASIVKIQLHNFGLYVDRLLWG